MDYRLESKVCLLHDKTFQALSNIRLVIVSDAVDAHHRRLGIHCLINFLQDVQQGLRLQGMRFLKEFSPKLISSPFSISQAKVGQHLF